MISDSLNNWPQQNGIIIYYEVTRHNESKLKNYLFEEKLTDELIKDIPVYKYFFYELLPNWNHFKEQLDLTSESCYPYINYFLKENNQFLYSKTLTSEDINSIMKHIKKSHFVKRKFLSFKYSNFKSLDDVVSFYSKNSMFGQKSTDPINEISIIYDTDKIERELSLVSHFLVEENMQILNRDFSSSSFFERCLTLYH